MLGELYYLGASLPSLVPRETLPFSSDAFLALCQGHLNEVDFEALRRSRLWEKRSLSPDETIAVVQRRWLAFESGLRLRLARLRAEKLGWQEELTIDDVAAADDGTLIRDAAQTAFEASSPLTAEEELFEARWRFLDDLDRQSFMTLDNIIVYYLKLQLLEGQASLSSEHGQQTLADLRRIVETELPDAEFFPEAASASAFAS